MEQFTYIVGDIHGCYQPLMALEKAIHHHAAAHGATPFIVSVGDLIDRGPQSREVVEHFRRGVQAGTHSAIAGNHEAVLFEVLLAICPSDVHDFMPSYIVPLHTRYERKDATMREEWNVYVERKKKAWLCQGGYETLHSFGVDPEQPATWVEAHAELQFLAALPMRWESERSIVSHALATASDIAYARQVDNGELQPERGSLAHAAHIEGLLWSREFPESAIEHERVHVSGHTPCNDVIQLKQQRRLMIDTACVYGNKLTAWCEYTDELLHVAGIPRKVHSE